MLTAKPANDGDSMFRILILILLCCCGPWRVALAGSTYNISYEHNGFHNYDHGSGIVLFYEIEFITENKNFSGMKHMAYRVNLKNREIIDKIDIDNSKNCIKYYPKLSPAKDRVISFVEGSMFLLNLESDECSQINYEFNLISYAWTQDGKVIFSGRDFKTFHLLNPKNKKFESYSHAEHSSFFMWNYGLNAIQFAYIPKKYLKEDNIFFTSDDLEYFYINEDHEWTKYEKKPPLVSSRGDVYFRQYSANEEPTTMEFFDVRTNEKISVAKGMGLTHFATNIVWLDNNWVYVQGSPGVFNYVKGKMVPFISDLEELTIPFAVDQNRYAIMYQGKEDRLKIFDLQEMKFISSYEPFWRSKK
jgi:hypothetical protein